MGKLQESVKKRKEVKDREDGHPKMSPNQLSLKERREKLQMKLAEKPAGLSILHQRHMEKFQPCTHPSWNEKAKTRATGEVPPVYNKNSEA